MLVLELASGPEPVSVTEAVSETDLEPEPVPETEPNPVPELRSESPHSSSRRSPGRRPSRCPRPSQSQCPHEYPSPCPCSIRETRPVRRNVAGCVALRRRRGAHRAVGTCWPTSPCGDVPAERTILTPAHERCATLRDEPEGCVAVIRGTVRSPSAQDIPENRLAHASRDRMTRVLGRRRRPGGVTSRDSWDSGRRSWGMVMRSACCRGSADGLRLTSGSSPRAAVVTRRSALGRTTHDCPRGSDRATSVSLPSSSTDRILMA